MLRGPRLPCRPLRMELPATVARDPPSGTRHALGRSQGRRHLLRTLPPQASAARLDYPRAPRRVAHRRDRPRRRSVRSVPVGAALRLSALHPGTWHHTGPLATLGRAHQQRHARAIGRAAQTLPLSLRRISIFRQGAADCRDPGSGSSGAARPTARRIRAVIAPGRSTAQARNRGNARLDGSPVAPRYKGPRRSNARGHSRQPDDASEDEERPRSHNARCRTANGRGMLSRENTLDRALCVRLTGFVSLLRENGFSVGVDDATLLVEAASRIGVLDPLVLRWSAQALLCRRAADQQRFADLFDSWFLPPNRRQLVETRGGGVGALERGDGARMGGEDSSEGVPVTAP